MSALENRPGADPQVQVQKSTPEFAPNPDARLAVVVGEPAAADMQAMPKGAPGADGGPSTPDATMRRAPVEAPVTRAEPPGPPVTLIRKASPGRVRGFIRRVLMLGGLIAVIVVSGYFYLRGGRFVVADNAYVRAAKLMVSTDISGMVASVDVKQGEAVAKDQILFRLDQGQFKIAVDAAKAQLSRVRLEVEALQRDYQRLLSDIAAQAANVARAQVTFDRADALLQRRAGSRAAFDLAKYSLDAEQQKLESLRHQAAVALTRLGGDDKAPVEGNPLWREAKAKVAEAERQLARTIVRAPFPGVVTAVESLQPGTFLVAQTAALTNTGAVGLVSTRSIWVEANIKETDLTHVRQGNSVDITIDAYPGRHWRASVKSIFPATGSEFSILPAQNASGNWVKVVQRIPVRIALQRKAEDPPLRAGMSAVVHIDTGHQRTMIDLWRLIGFKRDPLPHLSAWANEKLARP